MDRHTSGSQGVLHRNNGLKILQIFFGSPIGGRLMTAPVRQPRSAFDGTAIRAPKTILTLLSVTALALGSIPAFLPSTPQNQLRPQISRSELHQGETLQAIDSSDAYDFTPQELAALERHFGVHGPQPALAQLFFEGLGQFKPLRRQTLRLLEDIRPTLIQECARQRVNPMLVAAVLYEEVQLAKPGEHLPVAAHSGLIRTHGPAQISLEELVIQGRLRADATAHEKYLAVEQLLDPDENVRVLVTKFARLSRKLGLPAQGIPQISGGPADRKAVATLAYLYNGKLDYPGRILRHMEDPELHGLIFSDRHVTISALI